MFVYNPYEHLILVSFVSLIVFSRWILLYLEIDIIMCFSYRPIFSKMPFSGSVLRNDFYQNITIQVRKGGYIYLCEGLSE